MNSDILLIAKIFKKYNLAGDIHRWAHENKFKIFGNSLDLYYKVAGAGLCGALAFVFSIIISYYIQNIFALLS